MKEVKIFRNRLGAERSRNTLMRHNIPCTILQLKSLRVSGSSDSFGGGEFSETVTVTRYSLNVPDDLYEESVWVIRDVGTSLPLVEYMFPMVRRIRRSRYLRSHERGISLDNHHDHESFMEGGLGVQPSDSPLAEPMGGTEGRIGE